MAQSTHVGVDSRHNESRQDLRRRLLDARLGMSDATRAVQDAALAAHLYAWLLQASPALLGVYWPIRGEPDLRPLYAQLHAAGLPLALPVVVAAQAPLQFSHWEPDAAMTHDRWGIATPTVAISCAPTVLLIPCVGFNAARFRLGYGGGYYDRTLALPGRPRAVGVAHAGARAEFDAAAHDIAMDVVVTEAGIY